MKSSRPIPNRSSQGAVLIVAAALLFSALVFLTGALWVAQSRRERVHKTLVRDLAESEARALSLQYRAHLAAQFRGLASVNTNSWSPPTSLTTLATPPAPGSALFSRSLSFPALTITLEPPNSTLGPTGTAVPGHPLYGAHVRALASASTAWKWEPSGWNNTLPRRVSTPWQVQQTWSFEEVPLSIFHYHSSALDDTPAPSQSRVGRAHFAGNAKITAPIIVSGTLADATPNGTPPMTVSGTLSVLPGGALILGSNRAFAPAQNPLPADKAAAEYRSRFPQQIFEADANPITLCRPLTTAALFSTSDAGLNLNQKNQQLKPACDVTIRCDPSVSPPIIYPGSAPGVASSLSPFFTVSPDNIVELNMAPPGNPPWPTGVRRIWVEAAAPVSAVRIKNASTLPGPFSLATPLNIQVQGNFNNVNEQAASLLTFGIVIAEP